MESRALHTRLKPGKEQEYERLHARISDELDAALRAAGVHEWRIWRSGRELFHLVVCEDFEGMSAQLRDDPVNIAWQEQVNRLLESTYDYSGEVEDIHQVWELPHRPMS